jgi:pyrroline-5-carboxylate reductase
MIISKVAVVGIGVMGEAIINSLLKAGTKSNSIVIRDKRAERVQELVSRYDLNAESIQGVDAVILAVKPQDLENCVEELKNEISSRVLVVSLLAGVTSARISDAFGPAIRIIRVMPNTPILLGQGMSVIARGKTALDTDLAWLEGVLSKSGKTLVVDEILMDAVTATSGSGPAYFFGFVEAMIKASIRLGLSEQDSKLLVNQTLIGAAKMIEESGKDAGTLRKEVTSPNGTTAAALALFESSGFEEIVYKAMKAAKDRSEELGN